MRRAAAIGLRVKTGRAIAVVVAGSATAPQIIERRELQLWDAKVPESQQPYHAALDLPASAGAKIIKRASDAARSVTIVALRALVTDLHDRGCDLRGAGLVSSSLVDPEKLANAHVRAHAAEGKLLRDVLRAGAETCGLKHVVVLEREVYAKVGAALGRSADEIRRAIAALGGSISGRWAAEEKMAAAAACLMLGQNT